MSARDIRVAVLASGDPIEGGGGSTAERFIRDTLEGRVGFQVGVVVCNNSIESGTGVYPKVNALNEEFGLRGDARIEVVNISSKTHPKGAQERGMTDGESEAICRLFEERSIDFACMLGYMKIARGPYEQEWLWRPQYTEDSRFSFNQGVYHPNARTSNNHPAILPFTADTHGTGAHEKAIDLYRSGVLTHTAMTWHLASRRVDDGPIIDQEPIPIKHADTVASLSAKVQDVEKDRTALVVEKHLTVRRNHLHAA